MYISYSGFFFIFRQQMTTVREKKNKEMLHIIQWRALLLVRARFINSLVIKRKRISKQTTKVWPQVNESMPLIPCNEQNPLKNTIDIFFSILPEYPPLALLTFFFHSCITCMYVNKQKIKQHYYWCCCYSCQLILI